MERLSTVRAGNRNSLALCCALFSLTIVAALFVCGRTQNLFINLSPSIPVGLYLRQGSTSLRIGDTVVLRVSEEVRDLANRIGLLEHTKLLFKRVLAGPGEKFCFEGSVLEVGEREFGLRRETSKGLALPQLKGCSVLSPSEYLVIGDTEDSFDSRYFGAVREEDVVARVRPVVTF